MTDNTFFLQQVPQSAYRRSRAKKESDTTYLSTLLNPLGISDPSVTVALKAHIEIQADIVFGALLPSTTWDPDQRSKLLSKIYNELGLS